MSKEQELVFRARLLQRKLNLVRARKGHLLPFTVYTKPDYEVNWHHELTCRYLDAFIRKEIRFLMVFQPPRHGKSELTSRRLPALIHGLFPNDELLACSYNAELASDMTVDVQRIIESPEYQEVFPTVKIAGPGNVRYARRGNEHEIIPWQDPADKLWHYYTGSYRSAGVGGSFTGRGGNWILMDDPIKNREDADSTAFRETLDKFYRSTLRTRLEKNGSILITLTRWHEDDLAGRLIQRMKQDGLADKFTILNLPAIRNTTENILDPRGLGEPLWENKFNLTELNALKASLGTREFDALYQQSPISEGGNIVKRDKIKFYKVMPTKFDRLIQSWDFASSEKNGSAFTVGSLYGRLGTNIYLIDQVRGRWAFPMAVSMVKKMTYAHPLAITKLVEMKSAGPSIVQTLQSMFMGFVDPWEGKKMSDKVARLNAVTPLYEGGNVWYPDPSIAPWIEEHVAEMTSFPNGAFADRVDVESQALDYLSRNGQQYGITAGHGGEG